MLAEVELSENALAVARKRYLRKDSVGRIVETPREMFQRVAHNIALANELYDDGRTVAQEEREFFEMMARLEFLPNSPTLMNAGTDIQQLSACFVIPVDDSIDSIYNALKAAALIHQSGGGTGFSFSRLRPKGDIVKSTGGVASGPVSFMRVFDHSTEAIKQGGRRRGANMGILRVDHPDIEEFITSKQREGSFTNFNLSVAVTSSFMKKVESGGKYDIVHPRTGEVVGRKDARRIFHLMAEMAWLTGDPGIIFLDRIEEDNPTPALGRIEATNPCGEQPLLPYEACNLGSISLVKMLKGPWGKRELDWDKLEETVRKAVRFLDNVIDMSRFPLDEITRMVRGNRKIGLGIMGWADALIQMRIPYDSQEALELADKVMGFIRRVADDESRKIGEARGSFPNIDKSVIEPPMRNATRTTIAPTGTISLLADCSSGIEPLYAITYVKKVADGETLLEVNPYFLRYAEEEGFYSEELMEKVSRRHSIRDLEEVPEEIRRIFVTSHDVSPEWHVRVQAAFQEHVDNAVSKTINLRRNAAVEDIKQAFMLAWKLGCKGITVYRESSKREQPLSLPESKSREVCPDCGAVLGTAEGSIVCVRCGYSDQD
jgi:ribonucleoside-diphosphate reductase alpha chain